MNEESISVKRNSRISIFRFSKSNVVDLEQVYAQLALEKIVLIDFCDTDEVTKTKAMNQLKNVCTFAKTEIEFIKPSIVSIDPSNKLGRFITSYLSMHEEELHLFASQNAAEEGEVGVSLQEWFQSMVGKQVDIFVRTLK